MKEILTSKVYAQSALQLSKKEGVDISNELTKLTEVINSSNDLENVVFLDVFTQEEKRSVLDKIIDNISLSKLTRNFVFYLINEKRINMLPMIVKEIIVIDDEEKGFLRGTIQGTEDEINEDIKNKVVNYLKAKLGINPQLDYKKSESITAGYKVTAGDLQLDASLDNQLNKFKENIFQ